jgi:hypothetical protein
MEKFERLMPRSLSDFLLGAGIATLVVCCVAFLLMESALHGISSSVFRYVGF